MIAFACTRFDIDGDGTVSMDEFKHFCYNIKALPWKVLKAQDPSVHPLIHRLSVFHRRRIPPSPHPPLLPSLIRYALTKEKDLLERRDREEKRFRERQAQRQKMIDIQIGKLTDLNKATNQRLEKQAAEVQAKAMAAREKLDEQKKTELLVMHMSRQQQMRWKKEKKAQVRSPATSRLLTPSHAFAMRWS